MRDFALNFLWLLSLFQEVTIYELDHATSFVIVAKGRTHSRNRLYRMGISNNWQEINTEFEVYGLMKNGNYLKLEKIMTPFWFAVNKLNLHYAWNKK